MAERIVPDHTQDNDSPKPAVSRGARACTVCRAAKMKCVGAEEDGAKPCQRCRRSNLECIFEKHRRGRKPGSKLSEASKMLRKLEKGVNNQKAAKTHDRDPDIPTHNNPNPTPTPTTTTTPTPPQPRHPPHPHAPRSASSQNSMDDDDSEDDKDPEDAMYPAKMVEREGRRQSFFGTVLTNPNPAMDVGVAMGVGMGTRHDAIAIPRLPSTALDDPVTAGIIPEADLALLFQMVFVRLNPFINLFDPALHTPTYVRTHCPFLFTTLLMAGCKFWRAERFRACQRLAEDFCLRAFQEGWKRVEVVQAFMCMTYWKEPDDTRTWTYIGYASRMAVELGLNTHCALPPASETPLQRLERRNRERTYLVLWVHDRSLSMQTGRQWMLPEDDLVRHAKAWHKDSTLLPIDVVVSAQVQLRRIAAEVTDVFYLHKGRIGASHADVNYEILLRGCNSKLVDWGELWLNEIGKVGGERFHFSLLNFFKLHVRLFLNSFGLQSSLATGERSLLSLPALSVCYTSAVDTLKLVTKDFATVDMLRYGQDSITVMTAYSAVFLLKVRAPLPQTQIRR
ncbi:hypothetical protein K439DRAFT_1331316 [Ramaria rubella]|nr:hypothetical protein K439DRAFT_1331316 [Ramaria rubella]